MLKKLYISELIDDGVYECREDFPACEFLYCSSMTFEDFCLLHQFDLFSGDLLKVFVGVSKFSNEQLSNLVQAGIESSCCWITKKMDKRTKLYKSLKDSTNIEVCESLTAKRTKKSFIKNLMRSLDIPTKLFETIYSTVSDDKTDVHKELGKLKVALGVLPESQALGVLTISKADSQTLDFIANLFNASELSSARFAARIPHVPVPVLTSTLCKRLLSLIFLSKGETVYAKTFWDRNGYYVRQDTEVATRIGYKSLLKIYRYVDRTYGNFMLKDSQELRLSKLVRYVTSTINSST